MVKAALRWLRFHVDKVARLYVAIRLSPAAIQEMSISVYQKPSMKNALIKS